MPITTVPETVVVPVALLWVSAPMTLLGTAVALLELVELLESAWERAVRRLFVPGATGREW